MAPWRDGFDQCLEALVEDSETELMVDGPVVMRRQEVEQKFSVGRCCPPAHRSLAWLAGVGCVRVSVRVCVCVCWTRGVHCADATDGSRRRRRRTAELLSGLSVVPSLRTASTLPGLVGTTRSRRGLIPTTPMPRLFGSCMGLFARASHGTRSVATQKKCKKGKEEKGGTMLRPADGSDREVRLRVTEATQQNPKRYSRPAFLVTPATGRQALLISCRLQSLCAVGPCSEPLARDLGTWPSLQGSMMTTHVGPPTVCIGRAGANESGMGAAMGPSRSNFQSRAGHVAIASSRKCGPGSSLLNLAADRAV
jgi:hypothetical protein